MLSVTRNSSSDPRKGRARRVLAILALAAAAGAARAQQPLQTAGLLADIAADEARLLPCTVADVAGEFKRLAQTGTLKMEAMPCEPWVKMTIADGFGGSKGLAATAGSGANTIAFALSPEEAAALRGSGVPSGAAVPLNNLVTAVAVGPRTPGFGGSLGRLGRRAGAALGGAGGAGGASGVGAATHLDGGRAFPAQALYEPVPVFGPIYDPLSAPAIVENLDPNGAVVILTAAEPGVPVPGARGGVGIAPIPPLPVAVDARSGATLHVSGSGGLSPLPAGQQAVWAAVGGSDPSLPPAVVGSGAAVGALQTLGRR